MLDSKLLRTELDDTAEKLARRGYKLDVETIRTLEDQRSRFKSKLKIYNPVVIRSPSRWARKWQETKKVQKRLKSRWHTRQ